MTGQFLGPTVNARVRRIRQGVVRDVSDVVTTEEPLEIRLLYRNGYEEAKVSVSVTMRTPRHDYELAAGFLYTEGIINDLEEIDRISYCLDEDVDQHYNIVNVCLKPEVFFDPKLLTRNFYTTSSCGICGKASLEALELKEYCPPPPGLPRVEEAVIYGLPEALRRFQKVFERTGGLHGAGLFDPQGSLLALREDVGRHNAVDKLIGYGLLNKKLPFNEVILVVSGRSSYEIMQKALAAGIPMVVAVGAPSSLALDLARRFHMTLIGFARSDGFNIYVGTERVVRADGTYGS